MTFYFFKAEQLYGGKYMSKRTKLSDRTLPTYSKGEEIFNMVSHIVGGALGIAALVLCVITAAKAGRDVYKRQIQ